jgi:hypothetical protein
MEAGAQRRGGPFPGHPTSIDALLKDENTLLTGSSDGIIRAVMIHPDVLGDIGRSRWLSTES